MKRFLKLCLQYNIIYLFFWVDDESNYDRYKKAFLSRNNLTETSQDLEKQIKLEFKKNIQDRNYQDYLNAKENDLGAVTKDSYIIDTSKINPDQVLEIVLNKIFG